MIMSIHEFNERYLYSKIKIDIEDLKINCDRINCKNCYYNGTKKPFDPAHEKHIEVVNAAFSEIYEKEKDESALSMEWAYECKIGKVLSHLYIP